MTAHNPPIRAVTVDGQRFPRVADPVKAISVSCAHTEAFSLQTSDLAGGWLHERRRIARFTVMAGLVTGALVDLSLRRMPGADTPGC